MGNGCLTEEHINELVRILNKILTEHFNRHAARQGNLHAESLYVCFVGIVHVLFHMFILSIYSFSICILLFVCFYIFCVLSVHLSRCQICYTGADWLVLHFLHAACMKVKYDVVNRDLFVHGRMYMKSWCFYVVEISGTQQISVFLTICSWCVELIWDSVTSLALSGFHPRLSPCSCCSTAYIAGWLKMCLRKTKLVSLCRFMTILHRGLYQWQETNS